MNEQEKILYREEQTRLIKLLDALAKLDKNKDWETLKEMVFAKSLQAVERQMLTECLSPEISIEKLYKLQGEWVWAKQYTDVDRFIETLKKQLEEIKNKLS